MVRPQGGLITKGKLVISIGIKELLDAGVHFGHQTKRWNPKMKPFIFDARNGIHIIDLSKTLHQLETACDFLAATVAKGGKVLDLTSMGVGKLLGSGSVSGAYEVKVDSITKKAQAKIEAAGGKVAAKE